MVVEAAQRKPISQDATAGIFWFKSTKVFIKSSMNQILKGKHRWTILYSSLFQ